MNGFISRRIQNRLDKEMDSNKGSINVRKIEKVLEHRTRKLVVELKSELELATDFIIDAKSEDLKIDIEETAETIKEKLEGGLNDRFVNIASSIYSDIRRDIEPDLHRITDEKARMLIDEKIESKFLKNMKPIKHIEAKIDADKSKIKAEMINAKEDLVEKIIQIGSLFVLRQKEEEEKRKREWEPRHDNDEPNQKKRK